MLTKSKKSRRRDGGQQFLTRQEEKERRLIEGKEKMADVAVAPQANVQAQQHGDGEDHTALPFSLPPLVTEFLLVYVRRPSPENPKSPQQQAMDMLKAHPELVQMDVGVGKRLLHLVCRDARAKLPIIRGVLEMAPEVVSMTDDNNYLPIHYACYAKASVEVLKYLHDRHPACLKVKTTDYGSLPLHLACWQTQRHISSDALQFLTEAHPEAMMQRDSMGCLPLHHVACTPYTKLHPVKWLLEQAPQASKIVCEEGLLPLHYACLSLAPTAVIQLLLQSNWQGLQIFDSEHQLALHQILTGQTMPPLDMVQAVTQPYAQAVMVKDCQGNLPLDLLFMNYNDEHISDEMIRALVPAGSDPFHFACAYASSETMDVVAQKMPATYNLLPLHRACQNDALDVPAIRHMIEHTNGGVAAVGSDGNLPLHYACQRQGDAQRALAVVQCLVQMYPSALVTRNAQGQLPLDVAAMAGAPLDVRYYLLRQNPLIVKGAMRAGMPTKPVHELRIVRQ